MLTENLISSLGERTFCITKPDVGFTLYTPNANVALMFCFENTSPEKSRFVVDLVPFVSIRVFVFLKATRRDWSCTAEKCTLFQFPRSPLRGNQTDGGNKEFTIAEGTV